jgi:hypothetical protein
MMLRTEIDLKTGAAVVVELSADEAADVQARTQEETRLLPIKIIQTIEQQNPITHRALRELILTIGEIYPAGKNTIFYQRVLAAEQAIQAERAKL